VVDDVWSGRPRAAVTDVNSDKADQLLEDEKVLSLRELSGRLCHWKGFTIFLQWNQTWVKCGQGGSLVASAMTRQAKCVVVCQWNAIPVEQKPWLLITQNHLWLVSDNTLWPRTETAVKCLETHKDLPPWKKFHTATLSGKNYANTIIWLKRHNCSARLWQKQTTNCV
jgi:hypothetical protein